MIVVVLGIVGFALAQVSWAGEVKEEGVVKLEEIVVTATKVEIPVEDAPGSVTVISREEIERRNVQTVDEALSGHKGVFVNRTKGLMDAITTVRLRGFNHDRYTLILLDGQPLNNAYTGSVDWGMLPVDNIERIEVVRGAASALHGGSAMGGVINIITRTPERLEISATKGFGTYNTRRYRLSVGNRFTDRLSLRIGYEKESTDGYVTVLISRKIKDGKGTHTGGYAMDDRYGKPTRWIVGDRGENWAERSGIDGKAVFDFSDTGSLAFTAVSGKHEYGYGPPHTYMEAGAFEGSAIVGPDRRAVFSPNNFISWSGIGEVKTDIYTVAFKELFGPVGVDAQIGTTRRDDRYTLETGGKEKTYYDSPGKLKISEDVNWFSEVRADVLVGKTHLFTTGVSYRTDRSDTNDYKIPFYRSFEDRGDSIEYAGGKSRAWALFLQNRWSVAENLTLYVGGRYDSWKVYDGASGVPGFETRYDSRTDSAFSPKVAAVWRALPDTTFRASVGHAFRPPTLYELYRTWTAWGWEWKGNPDLGPETVWTYEMGVDQHLFNRKTRLSLTGYRNDIDDLIYREEDPVAKTRTFVNTAKARTYGLEFEASQEITEWLKAWVNYTWTDAEIKEHPLDPDIEGKRVTGIPKTMYNIGLEAEHEWFRGSLVGRYFSKKYRRPDNSDIAEGVFRTHEPVFLADGKVTFTPGRWGDISFSVDNIFDVEHFQSNIAPGRTILGELTIRY